jgi:Mrp family chromosome partitioning ATPase
MQMFGLGAYPGLRECLEDDLPLATSIYHLENPRLWILPAGGVPPTNALDLFQSGKLSALMDQLSDWFDWIIVDSPPVLPLADTSVWARLTEGIVLVRVKELLKRDNCRGVLWRSTLKRLIGGVLNCSREPAHSDYYYGSSQLPLSG